MITSAWVLAFLTYKEGRYLLTQFNMFLLLIQFIWYPTVAEAIDENANVAQDDERRWKPWFFTIGHNVAIAVVFPKIV